MGTLNGKTCRGARRIRKDGIAMGMMYHSTRNKSLVVSDAQAILQGLAPDGGLFVPEKIPTCPFRSWLGLSFAEVAERIFGIYFPSLGKTPTPVAFAIKRYALCVFYPTGAHC